MRTPKHFPGLAMALAVPALTALAGCMSSNQSGDLTAERFGDLTNPPAVRQDAFEELVAACGSPVVNPDTALRRAPYLQQLAQGSGRVLWTEEGDPTSALGITLPDGTPVARVDAVMDGAIAIPNGARQWDATMAGLAPDTIYCYSVDSAQGLWSRQGFRTAPAPGSARPVRFVALGDSGDGSPDQYAALAQMRTVPFDLIIHTGDIAYDKGGRSEFEANVFNVYRDLLAAFPFFPVAGNHEYETEGAQPFRDFFALPENGGPEGLERWYSFDWGDVHFVALDTERTGPVQAQWLDADLAANQRPWTVVYGHKPPFSSGEHGNDGAFRQYFVPVLEKHRVPLVLNGHDHDYERTKPQNGVTYVVTGGGGVGTRPVGTSSFTAFSESVIHIVYVEVTQDTLALHAIDGIGVEFDSLVLQRPAK